MIVNVQVRTSRRARKFITRKPFYGCFYSQWSYDNMCGNTPPKMSEDEFRRNVYFGNLPAVGENHVSETIERMNSERGEHERQDEYFASCDQDEHQTDEEDIQ